MTAYNITTASNFAAACKVFAAIEDKAQGFAEQLAALGIAGVDVKPYATAYVSQVTGVKAHPSQRGDTLTFKKDSSEYNRVKYLVAVVQGPLAPRKAVVNQDDAVAKLLKAYNKLDVKEQKRFLAAL